MIQLAPITYEEGNAWVLAPEPAYHYTTIQLYGYKVGVWLNTEHTIIGVNTFKENIKPTHKKELKEMFDKIKNDAETLIPPWDSFKYQTSTNDLAICWWNRDYLGMKQEDVFKILEDIKLL